MRAATCVLLAAASACRGSVTKDHGPPPGADHQATVRAVLDRVLDEPYRLDGAPDYRFAPPVPDRIARWHFEPQVEGRSHSFGYHHGWRVDFRVTPRYVGCPPQPESTRMAFFADGRLRGIFAAGGGNAPLELDRWSVVWVDEDWQPGSAAPPGPVEAR